MNIRTVTNMHGQERPRTVCDPQKCGPIVHVYHFGKGDWVLCAAHSTKLAAQSLPDCIRMPLDQETAILQEVQTAVLQQQEEWARFSLTDADATARKFMFGVRTIVTRLVSVRGATCEVDIHKGRRVSTYDVNIVLLTGDLPTSVEDIGSHLKHAIPVTMFVQLFCMSRDEWEVHSILNM